MSNFSYRADIDGLRAIAVTLVILFHSGLGFHGGFVGVDLFFVISGFLITGLILKEQDLSNFRLTKFWSRRICRILPASTLMVAAVLVTGFFTLLPTEYDQLGKSAVAQQLMISNAFFWRKTGYFDGPAENMPLLHTWSLAVEEQFYLVYPFLLILLHRFGRKITSWVLATIFTISFLLSEYGVHNYQSATFFLLPTRAWELLLGALINFLPKPTLITPWLTTLLHWTCLLTILAVSIIYSPETPFPGLHALVPCLAAAILIYIHSNQHLRPVPLLERRLLVSVGLMSYSLYLWHWPVFVYLRIYLAVGDNHLPPWLAAFALIVTAILSLISWRYVEGPMRKLSALGFKPIIKSAGLATGAVCLISGIIIVSDGFSSRFPQAHYPWLYDRYPHKAFELTTEEVAKNGPFELGVTASNEKEPIEWLIWGDSHAMAIAPAFKHLQAEHTTRSALIARSGTPPVFNIWQRRSGRLSNEDWVDAFKKVINANRVKRVVLVARWSYYLQANTRTTAISTGSKSADANDAANAIAAGLALTIQWLNERGIEVYLVEEVPFQPGNPLRNYLREARRDSIQFYGATETAYSEQLAPFKQVLRLIKGEKFQLVSFQGSKILKSGKTVIGDERGPFYLDNDHLSPHGAISVGLPIFEGIFQREK